MAFASSHPIWTIPEVVREVMKQSAYKNDTLAQCARVSRAFSSPALEVLWQEQDGLVWLSSLLPSSFRTVYVGNGNGAIHALRNQSACIVPCGEIREDEWARLQYYARLVRGFSCSNVTIDGMAAAMLIQKLGGGALMPRLRRLTWIQPFDTAAASLLGLFISPVLRTVSLHFKKFKEDQVRRTGPPASEYAYGAALQLIRTRAPKVEEIRLSAAVCPCSVDPLRKFENLRILDFWCLFNPALVLDLCRSLPLLETLSIRFVGSVESQLEPAIRSTLLELTHRGITNLVLTGSPALVLAVADAVHAPNLQSFELSTDPEEDGWKRGVALIASRFASLRTLKLCIRDRNTRPGDAWPPPPPAPFSFHAWFAPLYALRHLRDVQLLSFEVPFTITAKDIDDLTTGWPLLEKLALPAVDRWAPVPGPPITAFAVLAERCTHLTYVHAPEPDAAPLLETTRRARVKTCSKAMRSVALVGKGWAVDVHRKCRRYLGKLFPEAKIRTANDDDLEDKEVEEEVEEDDDEEEDEEDEDEEDEDEEDEDEEDEDDEDEDDEDEDDEDEDEVDEVDDD